MPNPNHLLLRTRHLVLTVGVTILLAACATTDPGATPPPTPPTTRPATPTGAGGSTTPPSGAPGGTTTPAKLRVLVTNDDGFGAAGIDAVVEGLRAEPAVEVTVVAPAADQSGTGGQTTPGTLVVTDVTTTSGYPAKAVEGFPADAVVWALGGGMDTSPDLIVSGNNEGANLGPDTEISGTIGAARAAAARGIPAVAVSQGLGSSPAYPAGVDVFLTWFRAHRPDIAGHTLDATVTSFNIPTCTTGAVRGVVEVPVAADFAGRDPAVSDCRSTRTAPSDDVDAFVNGFATESLVPTTPPS